MKNYYVVSKEDPVTGDWIKVTQFGSLSKAEQFCKVLESSPPYLVGSEHKLYLCIEAVGK